MTTLDRLAPTILDAIAHASLIAAALVLGLLILRSALRDRLSPRLRSLLWTLVLARLLVPVSLPAPSSPVPALTPAALTRQPPAALTPAPVAPTLAAPPARAAPAPVPQPVPPAAAGPRLSAPAIVLLVYLAGAALTAGLLLAGIIRSSRLVRRAAQIADPDAVGALERAKAELNLAGPIMLAQSPDCPTPVLIGTLRPVILLPQGLASQLSPDELRDLLMHELAHVKRRDIPLAWLWSIACILHWFNPLVHLAARCVRVDREPACDRLALSRLGPARAAAYGRTLLRLVAALPGPNPPPAPCPPTPAWSRPSPPVHQHSKRGSA
jgi:bla regulator protein BlaR1